MAYQLAVAVKLSPFAKSAVGCFHLLPLWEIGRVSLFPHIGRMEIVLLPAKRLLFEFSMKIIFLGTSARNNKFRPAGRRLTGQKKK